MSKNTISAIKFHPTKNIFATLGIDETLMIVNVDLDNIEKYASGKKDSQKVGTYDQFDVSKCDQLSLRGWGTAFAWSPNGKSLTVAVHNSTFLRVDLDQDFKIAKKLLSVTKRLPVVSMFYTDENTIVTAGYDNLPLVYRLEENKWVVRGACEKKADGFLIQVVYSAVEQLARNKEMEVMVGSRTSSKEFATLHFTHIMYSPLTQKLLSTEPQRRLRRRLRRPQGQPALLETRRHESH